LFSQPLQVMPDTLRITWLEFGSPLSRCGADDSISLVVALSELASSASQHELPHGLSTESHFVAAARADFGLHCVCVDRFPDRLAITLAKSSVDRGGGAQHGGSPRLLRVRQRQPKLLSRSR